jgi:transposase-like protein
MVRRPDLGLARQWRELISQQPDSGMTINAFCEFHQISNASFYQWRRKLSESSQSPNDQFVRVEVLRGQDTEPPVRVQLPCGAVLEIPSQQHELVLGVIDHLQRTVPPRHDRERLA